MSPNLFRKEVTAHRRGEWLGSIRLQPPRLGWASFYIGLLFVAAILGLLIGGHYTRHERVTGILVPSRGLLTLSPTTAGTVVRLRVHEGDMVRAGQALVEISREEISASLGDTGAAIADQLDIKLNRLKTDLGNQERLADLQNRNLRSRLALLNGQIAQVDQQIALQKQRADSAMTLYEEWAKAGNTGIISRYQLLQQHDTALQNLAQLKEVRGQAFQLRQQAELLEGQLNQLPATVSGKRNDTERQLADVAQSQAQNAARRTVLLRAPKDGVVTNILVHPGQTVTAQQSLVTVLPAHTKLLAELWIPGKAVGFMHVGQPVVMRYEAYPYQKFGQHIGRVHEVSRSAIPAKDVSRLLGRDITDSRYRVEVILDRQSVMVYGKHESLRPGMALDADVVLDRRRLIEWILEPLQGLPRNLHTEAAGPETGTL